MYKTRMCAPKAPKTAILTRRSESALVENPNPRIATQRKNATRV